MPGRDTQTVILSRQTILLVTAVGVGLLTLCYVLGVQVGKQSAALRHPAARGAGEDLQELPAPIADQLKDLIRSGETGAEFQKPAAAPAAPVPAAKAALPVEVRMPPAPAGAAAKPARPGDDLARWTLQLISTPDSAEAGRTAAKAKAAGFPSTVVAEKGLFKVRLIQAGPRTAMDATALRLKNHGFKPFAIKVE